MNNPINILDNNKQIELPVGIYSLKVLGGWKVITNNFSVILKEVGGETEIKSKDTFWRIQSFAFGKRAKKIASIDIPKRAKYEIEFLNAKEIKVKKSNLLLLSSFQNFIPTNEIQICIE
jgi:hypothetical protein